MISGGSKRDAEAQAGFGGFHQRHAGAHCAAQREPSGATIEQGDAEVLLQLPQLPRQGGLGDMHPRRGGTHASGVGHGREVAQMTQLHPASYA